MGRKEDDVGRHQIENAARVRKFIKKVGCTKGEGSARQ